MIFSLLNNCLSGKAIDISQFNFCAASGNASTGANHGFTMYFGGGNNCGGGFNFYSGCFKPEIPQIKIWGGCSNGFDPPKFYNNINGTNCDDTLNGTDCDDKIQGLNGNDKLYGYCGDDILDGGRDADKMYGGKGNDIYIVDNTGDVVVENPDEGCDTVKSSISYTLGANVENLTLTGNYDLRGIGNSLNNVIIGNDGNNVLKGDGGDDKLYGKKGNDTLVGGTGADYMYGDGGDDTYYVDDAGDKVVECYKGGTDLVISDITYTLADNVENLTLQGTDDLDGTGNCLDNVIYGNEGKNKLYGLGGKDSLFGGKNDDYLDGGIGIDKLVGGKGDDTYIVDNSSDVVFEYANEGIDTVEATASYILSDNLEILVLKGSKKLNGTGNSGDNLIEGNNAGCTIDGKGGNDFLSGGTGNDTYLFNKGSGLDEIDDAGGTDKVLFGPDVYKSNVAFFKDAAGNLFVDYGVTVYTDLFSADNWDSTGVLEKFQLNDGYKLSNIDVNKVIQDITAYATANSITLTSVADVKGNTDLMNIIVSAWT